MKKVNSSVSILGILLMAISTGSMAAGKSEDAYFVKVDRETTTQNTAQGDPRKPQAGGEKNIENKGAKPSSARPVLKFVRTGKDL